MAKNNRLTRRDFISNAGIVGLSSTIGVSSLLSSCAGDGEKLVPLRPLSDLYIPTLDEVAVDGKPLKAGLVGCGGRGTGAAFNFLDAGPNLQIVALGDLFQDRIDRCRAALKKGKNIDIPDNMCYTGFDAYKKVIDAGIDILIEGSVGAFRPAHFEAAVEAGKNVFMEKPGCVDPTGYRSMIATAKKAEAQGLCVIAGTHRRYQRSYVESFKLIQSGMIGQIVSGNIYWNSPGYGVLERNPEWSDMEFMIRGRNYWCWVSGDILEEYDLHNIDVMNWFIGKHPIIAIGQGARHRVPMGDTYDIFNVDFEYEGGIHISSMARHISGCDIWQSEFLQGTKGSWSSRDWGSNTEIYDINGNVIWKWDAEKEKQEFKYIAHTGCYTLEHVALINHIRTNTPVNGAKDLADSSLTAVMGRESAYTGKKMTWDEISNSSMNLLPEKLELGPLNINEYTVPVPGQPRIEPTTRSKNENSLKS